MNDCCNARYRCDCSCHYQPDVVHMISCCKECPHCKHNIETGYFDSHVKDCEAEMARLHQVATSKPASS